MRGHRLAFAVVSCLVVAASGTARAADPDTETRLRDALRAAIAQVRGLEDERATLLARQTESEKQKELLRQQLDALTAQLAERGGEPARRDDGAATRRAQAQQLAYEQAVNEFNRRLSAQNDAIGKLGDTLEKWKAAYNEAVGVARAKETERAKLAESVDGLTRKAASCEVKNTELFKIGNDILERYAAMDLGDVLHAREPFIGIKRVELENLMQDYQDKLLDQKAVP
jgi:chromosome segregation ATPase